MKNMFDSEASETSLVTTAEAATTADKLLKRFLKVGVIFLIITTFLVLIIAIVTLSLTISSNKQPIAASWNDQDASYSRQKRQSSRYDETIQTINSLGNFQADPCNDFYEFACGNFLKVAPPPPHQPFWSSIAWAAAGVYNKLHKLLMSNGYEASSAVRKTKEYYKSCVKSPSFNYGALLEVIRKLGGWPLLDSTWDEEAWSLQTSLRVAMKYQCFPLLEIRTGSFVDPPVPAIYMSWLTNPGEALALEAYQQAVYSTMQRVLGMDGKGGVMSEEVGNQIAEMWTFEKDVAEIMKNPGPFSYDPKMVSQIEPIFRPWVDVRSLLASFFNSSIKPTDEVALSHPYFFNNLTTVISNYSKKVLANYLVWAVVRSISTDIEAQFESPRKIFGRLNKNHTSQDDGDKRMSVPRWKTCMREVIHKFEYAIAHPFIKHHIEPSHKKEVEDMCEMLIKVAMKYRPDFFDKETMRILIKKLSKTKCTIAYPPFVMNITSLDQYYDKYQEGHNYLSNYIQYLLFLTHHYSTQNGFKSLPKTWSGSPVHLKAKFSNLLNQLTLYAGFFHSPLFHPQFSPEVSFGNFGLILAHELSHALLSPGYKFDAEGKKREWYTKKTKRAYVAVKDCYVKHYDKLEMFNRSINGKLTLEESMADSGGLWLAFQSLLEGYGGGERGWRKLKIPTDLAGGKLNRGQLFFVAYAQMWCSAYDEKGSQGLFNLDHTFSNIRMQGTLQNSKEFSRVFNCPPNTTFNPTPKCHIYAS